MPFGVGRALKRGARKLKYANPITAFSIDPKGVAKDFGKGLGLVPPEASTKASDTRAYIARSQWADYKKRFQPLENVLLGYASNPQQFKQQNLARAQAGVNDAFAGAQGLQERRLQSYGVQLTPEIQQRIASRLGQQKALSQVGAANVSDRMTDEQLNQIRSGGLTLGAQAGINQKTIGPSQG